MMILLQFLGVSMVFLLLFLLVKGVDFLKNTKQVLLSLSVNAAFYMPLLADSIGVSRSAFVSGLISGEYQVIKIDKGFVLLHFGRFVPEWNPLFEEDDLPHFLKI